MDSKLDYVAMLKSARNVQQQIDKFLHNNQGEIDDLEMTRVRQSVEKILNAYLLNAGRDTTANDSPTTFVHQHVNCDRSSAKSKMKELLDISSSFDAQTDTMNSCQPKQNSSDKKECQKVTNEDCNQLQTDLQEKVNHFEKHIKELECCLRDFVLFMKKLQLLNKDHQKREICLENAISKLKKKECHYKSRIQRLSKKLDYARKTSEERQQRVDGTVSKIEQLERMAEKNAKDWSDMAKSISSMVVDLSLSRQQPTCDDRHDGDDDDDDYDYDDDDDDDVGCSCNVDVDDKNYDNCYDDDCEDGSAFETKNKCDDPETLCCQPGGGAGSFLRPPAAHSTLIGSQIEGYPWPTTTPATTIVGWADDVGERSTHCSGVTAARTVEKSSRKAEPPSPCRQRPLSNLSRRHAFKTESGNAETPSSNEMSNATNGAHTTACPTTTTNCPKCNSKRMGRNSE